MTDFTPVPTKTVAYIGPAGGIHEAIVCRVNDDGTLNLVYVDIRDGEDLHGLNRSEVANVPHITEDRRRDCFGKTVAKASKLMKSFDRAVEKRHQAAKK